MSGVGVWGRRRRFFLRRWALRLATAGILLAGLCEARGADDVSPDDLPEPQVVVAKSGGEPIYASDVYAVLDAMGAKDVFTRPVPRELLRAALTRAIDQLLIVKQLAQEGFTPAKEDVDESLGALKAHFEAAGEKWNDYLSTRRMDENAARRRIRWTKSWASFLEERATDEALAKVFEANAREFDGTRLRARHILFKAPPGDAKARSAARTKAESLRARITAGELDFASAAEKHSEAESRDSGGDIGWVGRKAPMPEAFSRALFGLKEDEVGGSVETRAGVHLIQWTDIEPGKKAWQEARAALRERFAFEQFTAMAREARQKVKVEVTSALPGGGDG